VVAKRSAARARRRAASTSRSFGAAAVTSSLSNRLDTTAISKSLVGDTFTIPELRAAFEIVTGKSFDRGNFRRKFQGLLEGGVVERAPGKRATASKPAAVYRFRSAIG